MMFMLQRWNKRNKRPKEFVQYQFVGRVICPSPCCHQVSGFKSVYFRFRPPRSAAYSCARYLGSDVRRSSNVSALLELMQGWSTLGMVGVAHGRTSSSTVCRSTSKSPKIQGNWNILRSQYCSNSLERKFPWKKVRNFLIPAGYPRDWQVFFKSNMRFTNELVQSSWPCK